MGVQRRYSQAKGGMYLKQGRGSRWLIMANFDKILGAPTDLHLGFGRIIMFEKWKNKIEMTKKAMITVYFNSFYHPLPVTRSMKPWEVRGGSSLKFDIRTGRKTSWGSGGLWWRRLFYSPIITAINMILDLLEINLHFQILRLQNECFSGPYHTRTIYWKRGQLSQNVAGRGAHPGGAAGAAVPPALFQEGQRGQVVHCSYI